MTREIPEQILQNILDYLKCPNCGKCEQHQVDLTPCAVCGVMCCRVCLAYRAPFCDPAYGDFLCDECHKQNGQERRNAIDTRALERVVPDKANRRGCPSGDAYRS